LQGRLKETVDAVEDLLYRRCFPGTRLADKGIDHGLSLGTLAIELALGKGRPQELGKAGFALGPPVGIT